FQNPMSDLRVRVLAPAEEDCRLDLVTLSQEAFDVLLLELIVVFVNLRPELDLLHQNHLLVLLCRPRALLLLVLELAEVHDPAHGRDGRRRNFDEVESLGARQLQGLRRRHDAELRASFVNHADFTHTDPFVDPSPIIASWAAIVSDNYLLNSR